MLLESTMILAQERGAMNQTIAESVLRQPVVGVNLRPGALRDQLGDQPTLLVFLRHFG